MSTKMLYCENCNKKCHGVQCIECCEWYCNTSTMLSNFEYRGKDSNGNDMFDYTCASCTEEKK